MLQIRKIGLALIVLMSLGTASVEASYPYPYVDYWETLQEEKGYLTISSVWTESHPLFSIIRFFITEDQGNHEPMFLTVRQSDVPIIGEEPWLAGDLVFFKLLGEEDYYVTNLRTQATVIVIEPLGLQHQLTQKELIDENKD